MEIIRNTYKEIQFRELHVGDVFIAVDKGELYMKTRKAYEFLDDPDHSLNVVCLKNGSLDEFEDWEMVRVPKKVVLTVDE